MIDFNLNQGEPNVSDDVKMILQQIDILFGTAEREVLGDIEYGTRYDYYLYNLQLSADELKNEVLSDIYSIQLFGFKPTVNVYLLQGTEQDIALIEIILTRDEDEYKKIYKIS